MRIGNLAQPRPTSPRARLAPHPPTSPYPRRGAGSVGGEAKSDSPRPGEVRSAGSASSQMAPFFPWLESSPSPWAPKFACSDSWSGRLGPAMESSGDRGRHHYDLDAASLRRRISSSCISSGERGDGRVASESSATTSARRSGPRVEGRRGSESCTSVRIPEETTWKAGQSTRSRGADTHPRNGGRSSPRSRTGVIGTKAVRSRSEEDRSNGGKSPDNVRRRMSERGPRGAATPRGPLTRGPLGCSEHPKTVAPSCPEITRRPKWAG